MNIKELSSLIYNSGGLHQSLQQICNCLITDVNYYTWVGFYFMNYTNKTLHLGPFAGKPTDHLIIPFGKGICGQVAQSGSTYIAENVNEESNYIACSVDVKSEIVVPLYVGQELIAQIDIDSDEVNAFGKEDEKLLKDIAELLAKKYPNELKNYLNVFLLP